MSRQSWPIAATHHASPQFALWPESQRAGVVPCEPATPDQPAERQIGAVSYGLVFPRTLLELPAAGPEPLKQRQLDVAFLFFGGAERQSNFYTIWYVGMG